MTTKEQLRQNVDDAYEKLIHTEEFIAFEKASNEYEEFRAKEEEADDIALEAEHLAKTLGDA